MQGSMKTVFLIQLSILQDKTQTCPVGCVPGTLKTLLCLGGFQTHSMKGNHTGNWKTWQNPMSEKVIGSRGELTSVILLNGCAVNMSSVYFVYNYKLMLFSVLVRDVFVCGEKR